MRYPSSRFRYYSDPVYHLLTHRTPFHDLSAEDYEQRARERDLASLRKRAAKLGLSLWSHRRDLPTCEVAEQGCDRCTRLPVSRGYAFSGSTAATG
jgi:hypothetical protein